MTIHFKLYFSLLLFLIVISTLASSEPQNEVPGEVLARMQQTANALASPNKNHEVLAKLTGSWTTSSTVLGLPPTEGTAEYSMILGNRFLDGKHSGTIAGIPFIGRMTIGYDNYKHKFVASYIDDLNTSIRTAEGMLDRNGNTLSLWGTMDEWMSDEHDKPVLYKYTFIDKNHFDFEIHDLSLGNDKSLAISVSHVRN